MTNDESMTNDKVGTMVFERGRVMGSFPPDGTEDEMQFLGFLPKNAGFLLQISLSGCDHEQKELGFASFLSTGADFVFEVLPRDAIVRLAVIGSDTRAGPA